MDNVNSGNAENPVEGPAISEIVIKETKSKLKKVKILLNNTGKEEKTLKKDNTFRLLLDSPRLMSHFTAYMHYNTGIFARINPPRINEIHVNVIEHLNGGDIDSDNAKIVTRQYGFTTVNIRFASEVPLPTTEVLSPTTEGHPLFRILVIGKTGVGKSSLINVVFGLSGTESAPAIVSDLHVGKADIEHEITPNDNKGLILHDSRGFEAGEEGNLDTVVNFIKARNNMESTQDKVHAVWLCLRIPVAGGPLADAGIEKLLEMKRNGEFGDVPFIVVYTQYDELVGQVKYRLRNHIPKVDKVKMDAEIEKWFSERCLTPFQKETDLEFPYVRVSTQKDSKNTIEQLVELTLKNISAEPSNEPRRALVIAQRVIPWRKIQTSIEVGRAKYWKSMFMGTLFRGHSLQDCLGVLHTDIIAVWNLNDEYRRLRSRQFQILLYAMVQDVVAQAAPTDAPVDALASNLRTALGTAGSIMSSIAVGTAAAPIVFPVFITLALLQWAHKVYSDSHDILKQLMTYVIDLILIMQNLFLIIQAQSTPISIEIWMVKFAIRTYTRSRIKSQIHTQVQDFVDNGGLAGHGRDNAVDEIENLINKFRKNMAEEMKAKIAEGDPRNETDLQDWGVEMQRSAA